MLFVYIICASILLGIVIWRIKFGALAKRLEKYHYHAYCEIFPVCNDVIHGLNHYHTIYRLLWRPMNIELYKYLSRGEWLDYDNDEIKRLCKFIQWYQVLILIYLGLVLFGGIFFVIVLNVK